MNEESTLVKFTSTGQNGTNSSIIPVHIYTENTICEILKPIAVSFRII